MSSTSSSEPSQPLTLSGLDRARAFVDAVLSLNRLAKERWGEEPLTANSTDVVPTLQTLDQVDDRLAEIERELPLLDTAARAYLGPVLKALRCVTRILQGDAIPYLEQVATIQEIQLAPAPPEEGEALRAELAELLGRRGYRAGDLAADVARWVEDTRLTGEALREKARQVIARSKAETLEKVVTLPPEDSTDVAFTEGVYWSAYSRYQGDYRGIITLNADRPWTEAGVAHVMCHEGYPGHQAFYCLWDYLYRQGQWPMEAAFYFTNQPHNALFEGAPENGLHFLGWDQEEEFRLASVQNQLQKVGNIGACYFVNHEGMEREEAIRYMCEVGLVPRRQAELNYRFMTNPMQRTYYPAYYYGEKIVRAAYEAVPDHRRFFQLLYYQPQTVSTLKAAVGLP